MKYLARLARTDNWLQSKIPPILTVLFAGILFGQISSDQAYTLIAHTCVSIMSVAVYGHFINDIFDVNEDRLSNKPNVISSLPRLVQFFLCLLCLIAGFLPFYGREQGLFPCLLLLTNFIAPTLYSVPPFSLKYRGLAGALMDSLGAHVIPSMFTIALIAEAGGYSNKVWLIFLISVFIWSFVLGFRGIIVHQVAHRQKDLDANVITFGGQWQPEQLCFLVIKYLLPIEIFSISVFIGSVFRIYPLYFSIFALYLILELAKIKLKWKLPVFYPDLPLKEKYIPLLNNELYEFWLPSALLMALLSYDSSFIFLLLGYLVVFWPGMKIRSRVVLSVVFDIRRSFLKC